MIRAEYTKTDVDGQKTGSQLIGFVNIHEYGGAVKAKKVVVQQNGGSDAQWNIQLDGRDVFATTQSVTTSFTSEAFYPDQNLFASGETVPLRMSITSAAASPASNGSMAVTVLLETTVDE